MDKKPSILKHANTLGSGLVVSRILGLIRDITIVFALGSTAITDAFIIAFRVPNFVRRLLQEGATAFAFIPIFNRRLRFAGNQDAFTFGRGAIVQLTIYTLAFVGLCIFGSRIIALVLAPGFAEIPNMINDTALLIDITFLYIPLVFIASVLSGMLLTIGKMFGPAVSPAAMNTGIIAAALYAITSKLTGFDAAVVFCYGLVLGGFLQILIQLPPLYRAGFRIIGPVEKSSSYDVTSFIRNSPSCTVGSATYQFGILLSAFFASFLGHGSVSALYLAERIIEFPLSFIGVGLGLACIANFSTLVLQGRAEDLAHEIKKVLRICAFFTFPAMVGIFVIAKPLVKLIYLHGAFDIQGAEMVTRALLIYLLALPALVAVRPILAALNAMGKQSMTMALSVASLFLHISLTCILLQYMGLEAIAISAVVACWFNLFLLSVILKGKSSVSPYRSWIYPYKHGVYYFLLSLVMGAIVFGFKYWAEGIGMAEWLVVVISIFVGIFVYVVLCKIFKSSELSSLIAIFRKDKEAVTE